ncbi:cellobiose phosphorylase [Bartonella callosciuri]|uniref:Cellobiose phosphorylase n=1 Tax=Bartonella callosciuri TaxID=686223 RepID=A0A840NRZ2_9HYPH|nr:cellobiose phosphorylase [Bartonella callosciuri]
MLKAHEYWRMRGLIVDLIILNEQTFSYIQNTQHAIEWVCEPYRHHIHETGERQHIFTFRRDQMNEQSFKMLLASARIVLYAQNGSLSEQLKRLEVSDFDLGTRKSHQELYYLLCYLLLRSITKNITKEDQLQHELKKILLLPLVLSVNKNHRFSPLIEKIYNTGMIMVVLTTITIM